MPLFRAAILSGGPGGGALPRRRFRRPLLFSLGVHAGVLAWLVSVTVLDVGPVPPPPLTIQFFAAAPPPPRLVPLRDRQEPPRREAPRSEARRPRPGRPEPPRPTPSGVLPLPARTPLPAPREQWRPEPIRVQADALPIRVPDAAPRISIVDAAPVAGGGGEPSVAPLGALTTPQSGTGEDPDLAFLVPGEARARGTGGGIAGRDVARIPPASDAGGSVRRGGAGSGPPGATNSTAGGADDGPAGMPGGSGLGRERAFTAAGLASYLSRRYGVTLMEASGLGSRTTDGARYALLLPALSEAYRAVPFRGRRRGAAGDAVETVQVDADAIAIRYRDGTLHVLAPTSDGLVALFVSSRGGASGRSKVQEAERALGALHRFARDGAGGRKG
jgi:hypothetical protein